MKLRLRFSPALFTAYLVLALVLPAFGQEAFRSLDGTASLGAPPRVTEEVTSLLDEGLKLEQQARWGEALTHYESATRRFPENSQLQARMGLARIHFDLARRYADDTYLTSLQEMQQQQAQELLAEVMLKVQSHYVHEPDWNQLLSHGTNGLSIALLDKDFNQAHGVRLTEEQVRGVTDYVAKAMSQREVRDRKQAQDMVGWASRVVEGQLRVPSNAILMEYLCSMANSLDPYSTYLTAEQLDEVFSQIEGNFVGLGIELKPENGALTIADVIPRGPAERAGIRPRERIVAVDGRATRDLSAEVAADLLKGEEGTFVQVTMEAVNGQQRSLQVRRERVEVPSVEDVRMLDPAAGVAYFRISSFQKTTSRDVDAALWRLHREGMRSLVVDVRGNPGGLLNEAVEVADRFLQEGTIVETHGRSARENFSYKANRVGTWRVPLVVLIDGDSASASEIFAGAVRDHRRGTVVGDRSYGKGSVQGIFPLRVARGGVRLTTAKFYSPSGRAISQGGVEPDVTVRATAKPVIEGQAPTAVESEDDEVLKAGLELGRRQVSEQAAQEAAYRDQQRYPAAAAASSR